MKYSEYPVSGKFGRFGGQFVPETLIAALRNLEDAYREFCQNQEFLQKLNYLLEEYAGRPTPLYLAENLAKVTGGARIFLKREDLLHGGAHKINNTLGQGLLAKAMDKNRIIAETGAGQHGVATAIAAAALGLKAEIYMGTEDMERQKLNVFRMRLLGAKVHPVESGSKTLKDAINEALRDWVTNVESTYYLIGSVVGPHPYPMIVRDFQSVIGREIKSQFIEKEKSLPSAAVACVGGGSNAIGTFYPLLNDDVKLFGVEAGGEGLQKEKHAAALCLGEEGVLHGMRTFLLQDEYGQILGTKSVAAGLDYPGVGPEHAFLRSSGRVEYATVSDEEALKAFHTLSRTEGIIPALESAHALAYAVKLAPTMKDTSIVVTLSGRGDKDVEVVAKRMRTEV